jgi:hypothetical protein
MEERIKRMESTIIASGLQGPAGLVNVKEEEEEEEEKTSSDRIESQAKLSNQLANLVIDSNGSSNFIGVCCFKLSACLYLHYNLGSASGFSLFSPHGVRWISQKVGDKEELAQLYRILSKHDYESWGHGNINLWAPKSRSEHSPLPTKEVALEYVNCTCDFQKTEKNMVNLIINRLFHNFQQRLPSHESERVRLIL